MQLRSGKTCGSTKPTSNKETNYILEQNENYVPSSYKVLRSGNTYGSYAGSKCFLAVRKFIHYHVAHPVRECNSSLNQLYKSPRCRNRKSYPDTYDFIEDLWRTFKPHIHELTNNSLYEKLKDALERKIAEFIESMEVDQAIFYSHRSPIDKKKSLKRAYELMDLYNTK